MDDEGLEVAELQLLADSLSCPLCKEVLEGPVVSTVCGHICKPHRNRPGRAVRGLPRSLSCTRPPVSPCTHALAPHRPKPTSHPHVPDPSRQHAPLAPPPL